MGVLKLHWKDERSVTDNIANQTLHLLRELRSDFNSRLGSIETNIGALETKLNVMATVQLHQAARLDKIDGRFEKMENDLHYLASHLSLSAWLSMIMPSGLKKWITIQPRMPDVP
jgi:hypothetical protein